MTRLITVLSLLCLMAACRPEVFPPKPPGYFKIDTPAEHRYQVFDRPGFPYTFEYPAYATVKDDTVFQGKGEHNPYWVNIDIPSLGGVINITYKRIQGDSSFAKLMEDFSAVSSASLQPPGGGPRAIGLSR